MANSCYQNINQMSGICPWFCNKKKEIFRDTK